MHIYIYIYMHTMCAHACARIDDKELVVQLTI